MDSPVKHYVRGPSILVKDTNYWTPYTSHLFIILKAGLVIDMMMTMFRKCFDP